MGPGHGKHGLGFQLRDGKSGAAVTSDMLAQRLRPARAIYVGEHHNNALSHHAQLFVLSQTYRIDHDVAVGLEMLPRRLQPQLDAFLAGAIDEGGFLAAVDWSHTWGFDYDLYRPIFEFCRTHGLRMFALNAPRDLPRAVRQKGIDGLSPGEQAQLPSGYPWPTPDAHRQFVRAIFDQHPAAPGSDPAARDAAFERFYSAQLIWDESMAQEVATILTAGRAPQRLIVLAGVGHVGPLAIPGRAARRGVPASLTLGPIEEGDEPLPTGAEAVDVALVLKAHHAQAQ